MAKIRAFIGVELSCEIKKEIAVLNKELRLLFDGKIKWVEHNNFHINLMFLGNIEEDKIDTIYNSLKKSLAGSSCFDIQAGGVGAFPNFKHINVLWFGILKGIDELKKIQSIIQGTLPDYIEKSGHKEFIPHITLARAKNKLKIKDTFSKESWKKITGKIMKVDRVCLFESKITSKGPEYIIKRVIKL
ncbi:RNA 2',3'-cyclic phosphodiesterase [bacterium]